jgi:hypothetical protein
MRALRGRMGLFVEANVMVALGADGRHQWAAPVLAGIEARGPSQIAVSGGGLALPSEGKGHTFESCRVRQFFFIYNAICRPSLRLQFCFIRASKQLGEIVGSCR